MFGEREATSGGRNGGWSGKVRARPNLGPTVAPSPVPSVAQPIESSLPDACALCLSEYEPGERLRLLPCLHCYYAACVDRYLLRHSTPCPLCRFDLRKPHEPTLRTKDLATLAGPPLTATRSLNDTASRSRTT